MVFLICFFFN